MLWFILQHFLYKCLMCHHHHNLFWKCSLLPCYDAKLRFDVASYQVPPHDPEYCPSRFPSRPSNSMSMISFITHPPPRFPATTSNLTTCIFLASRHPVIRTLLFNIHLHIFHEPNCVTLHSHNQALWLIFFLQTQMNIFMNPGFLTINLISFSDLNKLEAGCVELDDGSKFELVEKFCYLGDMLCAGGGAEEASRTRVRSAWGKFNELAPVLTKRGVSLKLKGKIYDACVQRVLVYW